MATQSGIFNAPPPKEEKKQGLFSSHKQQAPGISPEVINQLDDSSRRLRILEERYTNLQTKTQVMEQNMLNRNKHLSTEIKTVDSDIHELKREIIDIKNKVLMLIKEMQNMAKKEEIKVLQKYVNMWEPVKFVTQSEVEDIVRRVIDKMREE